MKTNMKINLKIQSLLQITALLFCLMIAFPQSIQAQSEDVESSIVAQEGSDYTVTMKNGDRYTGTVLSIENGNMEMETSSSARITIPLSEVKSLKLITGDEKVLLKYNSDNASRVRYFLTPSAFSLKKGEAYYQNSYLFANIFHVGVTDNFSIGGGFDFLSLSNGTPVLMIMPRFTFEIDERLRAGVGITYAHSFFEGWGGVGYAFTNLTVGGAEQNVTIGGGLGFVNNEGFNETLALLTLSGMTRVSNRVSLMTENYLGTSNGQTEFLSIYGLRFQGKGLSADLGLVNNNHIAEAWPIGIPYVGFAVKF